MLTKWELVIFDLHIFIVCILIERATYGSEIGLPVLFPLKSKPKSK